MYSAFVTLRFVILVALAACGDHELENVSRVRDEVCACKTVVCADTALAKLPSNNVKSTPRSQKIAREMLDCLADVYSTDRPTIDPDAPE